MVHFKTFNSILIHFIKRNMLLHIALSGLLILAILLYYRSSSYVKYKNVLVIGGSSGIGLEIARILYKAGGKITITSRSKPKLDEILKSFPFSNMASITGFILDSKSIPSLVEQNYDAIFYCAGFSIPGYFSDQNLEIFQQHIDVNYIGMLRSLYFYKKYNKNLFDFIVFSSTLALFPIPGFASYSPSKICLKSFFETEKDKLESENIHFKIVYCCSMSTPGFEHEETMKPDLTKKIEHSNVVAHPASVADYVLRTINSRDAIAYDWFTYFAMIRNNCEILVDYLLFPLAVVVMAVAKVAVSIKTKNFIKEKLSE